MTHQAAARLWFFWQSAYRGKQLTDGRVCAISLFDATFARLDPVVAG